jgi:hypothetical protein
MAFGRNRETSELWINQNQYIKSILTEYAMTDYNPIFMPMDSTYPWAHSTDNLDAYTTMFNGELQTRYR